MIWQMHPFFKPNPHFWAGKSVLLTGHTGFKGSWLAHWLSRLGAKVIGIGLPPNTSPNLFDSLRVSDHIDSHYIADIRNFSLIDTIVKEASPEVVFHLAAQPLVLSSYSDPLLTFETNLQGTVNLLESLRSSRSFRVAVMITTDKVYQNNEGSYPFRETDPLGGHDPYSSSKAASEIAISSYRKSFFKEIGASVASARAGNVIGGGDWSQDRLVPDLIRAWSSKSTLHIRNPTATRPWQHVLEPLAGYICLAEHLWRCPSFEDSFNFGPYSHETASVIDILNIANVKLHTSKVEYQVSPNPFSESKSLSLDISKAQALLGFYPRWNINEAITRTLEWYSRFYDGSNPRTLCNNDIDFYESN